MRSLASLLALTLAAPALAVPLQLTHQGSLADDTGAALEGAHQLTVAIYAEDTGGSALWTDTLNADLDGGAYSIVLGAGAALDSSIFDGSIRYVELSVDGGAPLPQRLPVTSVPYAFRAGNADSAALADALANPIQWSDIQGAPDDADTLADLLCDAGQVATFDGLAWGCASPASGEVDASALTGTISVDNLPVGTSSGTIAAGDHTHGFGQITGQAAVAQLPVGTDANSVAAGDHTHSFDQITGTIDKAQLPTLTAADVGALPAGGGVKVGDAGTTCGSAQVGTLSYASGQLRICTATGWLNLATATDGSSQASAATSCFTLHAEQPSLPTGVYWINPDGGSTSNAFRVTCDMTTRGGGWTRVYYQDSRNNGFFSANQAEVNKADPTAKVYAVLNDLQYFRREGAFEMLMRWPGASSWTQDQVWKQTSNPVTDSAGATPTGYQAISIPYTVNGWSAGLQRSASASSNLLDGTLNPNGNWYYAVGTTYCWGSVANGCMPGPDGQVHVAELWVR
jgi:hypothetical protein